MRIHGWMAGGLLLLLACGSKGAQGQACVNGTDAGPNGSIQSAILGDGCGGLNGTAATGQPCKTGADCAPACCSCGSLASGKSAAVGYCEHQADGTLACAASTDTCCPFLVSEANTTPNLRTCQ